MNTSKSVVGLSMNLFILLAVGNALGLDCPKAPEQVRKDWEVEVAAAIVKIGPVKGGELTTRTRNATQDLLGKLPDAGRIYLEQMMFAAYCSALRDDKTIKESEKAKLLKAYSAEVRDTIARSSSRGKEKSSNQRTDGDLKGLRFSEKAEKVSFSLGERGIAVGYKIADLEKSLREPFNLNNFSPAKVYARSGIFYADVKVFGGSGAPPIEIKNNQLLNKPPNWDFNSNDKAIEIVNEDYLPLYQFYYKSPSHIVVNGVFPFPGGLILADENRSVMTTSVPVTVSIKLKRIFKYPSWKYPGQFDEQGNR